MMDLKNRFIENLKTSYKGLANQPLDSLVSENLISPFTVKLPKSVLTEAQLVVESLYGLREQESYQKHYESELQDLEIQNPGNKAICMSYDFHLTAEDKLKLIEVNTNAAFLALGVHMYQTLGQRLPITNFSLDEMRTAIQTELSLNGKKTTSPRVAIIDETPEQQRLYLEFLAYNELFKSWGWDSKISDYRHVDLTNTDFVYNRYTDFFLNAPESKNLKEAFLKRSVCFSPNPYEYFLLADKQRMVDWSLTQKDNPWIASAVPHCEDLSLEKKEETWSQRKGLFFKPKHAFGSKQSYKGASISRKAFDEIAGHDFIAQEYIPAPEQVFETPKGPQSFKYDLRCYAYQGRVQLILARLYQGQVTNLRTPYGGFACVEFL